MLVYRVEMPDGTGPYRSRNGISPFPAMCREHCGDYQHPAMFTDWPFSLSEISMDYYCGFHSINQLKNWFEHFLDLILDKGGQILQYEIDPSYVIHGESGKQLFFKRDQSTDVDYAALA